MRSTAAIDLHGTVEGATAERLVPNLAAAATGEGFKVAAPVPGTLMLSRSFRPGWTVVIGLVLVGIAVAAGSMNAGPAIWFLVALGAALIVFVKHSETVSLVVTDSPSGARVDATGTASGKLEEFVGGILSGDA